MKLSKTKVNRVQHHEGTSNRVYGLLYYVLSRNLLTKRSLYNIRSRLEMIGQKEERLIRKKSVQIILIIMTLVMLLFMTVVFVAKQWFIIGLFLVVLWFLSETLVDFFVTKLKNRLLAQQIKLNDLIRHKYYETQMVDEAIYLACQSLDQHHHEINLQGQRMYDILTAKDVEKEMVMFNETAPNKFLKMLLGLAYITMEYGDHHVDGQSVFMKNLSDLTNEIRIELSKRERLNYALRSLNVIVLIPLFCITPIKNWASYYFMPLKVYYESQAGLLLEVVSIFLIFLCYFLLRRVQKFEDGQALGYRKKTIDQRLYEKWLYPLIDYIKPRNHKGKYFITKRQLKMIASSLSVEAYTTRKFLCFVGGFLFGLCLFLGLHYNAKHQVLTAPTLPDQFLGGQLTKKEQEKAEAITRQDTQYLSQLVPRAEEVDVVNWLVDQGIALREAEIVAKRLLAKQIILQNQSMKWWEVLVTIGLGLIGYQLPFLYLKFQQKVVKIDIEDEVTGYGTIILMLMHHERLSVIEILEWMEMFSATFKEPIGDCLNNSAAGLTQALEQLREVSDNERFLKVIDSLILASMDITIRQAFDELESEKSYYLEERKEINGRIVEKKINLGRMIGFIPIYALIVLYMIVPMITTSVTDMNDYFNQLKF